MEDTFRILSEPYQAFGIFDGHSGSHAAEYAAENLLKSLTNLNEQSVISAFIEADSNYCNNEKNHKDGTTATVACISGKNIIAGNVGDSRCVVISETGWEMLSYDHIASDLQE